MIILYTSCLLFCYTSSVLYISVKSQQLMINTEHEFCFSNFEKRKKILNFCLFYLLDFSGITSVVLKSSLLQETYIVSVLLW
jgi:hypothetical protein